MNTNPSMREMIEQLQYLVVLNQDQAAIIHAQKEIIKMQQELIELLRLQKESPSLN